MAGISDRPRLLTLAGTSRSDALALGAGVVTVVAWGSAFVGIRAATHSFSPGSLALGRLVVSGILLGAVALVRRERLPQRRDLLAIAVYGVLWLAVYSATLNAAERLVDAGTAAMLINTGPILIAILAGLFLREGFPPALFAGSAVAFAGAVVIGLATTRSAGTGGVGLGLCVVAALAYATAVVVQKPVLARVSSFQVTWLGVVAAAVALVPFGPSLAAETAKAGLSGIGWVIYLGAVPTALGFATWGFALRRTSAGRMASLTFLIPVVAIVLGWVLLGETPPLLALAGGALCIAGVYVARRPSPGSKRSEAIT
ncbi:MAG TPA: DMT family transporter [Candidatus Limnocylindrales bacterium]|nr:DMT family transporter [Candidatus Limnocylindrales bacterium]